jgi:hypothetical protein
MRWILTIHLCCALQATALAAPGRRFALVIGANRGAEEDQPLKFAEADADRMARVLRDLGGFSPGDVVALATPSASQVLSAMDSLSGRVAAERAAGRSPLLLFYYSGHADGEALHVGPALMTFGAIRRWLESSRASVRLAVVDACRSGALTRVKGVHAAPAIEVRLSEELATRGEAVITSSTADEAARESDGLRGSFFTHHFVSGLRGAADQSRDGRVTLGEAYDYAYAHTVAQASGGQHPTFKYDLAGRGDIVLTSLSEAGAWLSFGDGASGWYFILTEDGTVLGEVDVSHGAVKVAVAPGRYELRKRTLPGHQVMHVTVARGEERAILDADLEAAPTLPSLAKGDEQPALPPSPAGTQVAAPPRRPPPPRFKQGRLFFFLMPGFGVGWLPAGTHTEIAWQYQGGPTGTPGDVYRSAVVSGGGAGFAPFHLALELGGRIWRGLSVSGVLRLQLYNNANAETQRTATTVVGSSKPYGAIAGLARFRYSFSESRVHPFVHVDIGGGWIRHDLDVSGAQSSDPDHPLVDYPTAFFYNAGARTMAPQLVCPSTPGAVCRDTVALGNVLLGTGGGLWIDLGHHLAFMGDVTMLGALGTGGGQSGLNFDFQLGVGAHFL